MIKRVVVSLIIAGILSAAGGYYYYRVFYVPEFERRAAFVLKETENILIKKILIDPLLIVSKSGKDNLEYTARLPMRFNEKTAAGIFEKYAKNTAGITAETRSIILKKGKGSIILIKLKGRVIAKIRLLRNNRPKIAIILDDWGYHGKTFSILAGIKQPLTMAVLPGLAYSKKAAWFGRKLKKEVILHLPMEPKRRLPLEKNTIKANMAPGEIAYIVNLQLKKIGGALGVNNHQGSLVTEKKSDMRAVMGVLKKKGLFFIDSRTSVKSIAYKIAKEEAVLTNRRNIFIDNKKDEKYVIKQLGKLKKLAEKRGWAIGIGHDNPITLKAIKKEMRVMKGEGVEFVYVSELLF